MNLDNKKIKNSNYSFLFNDKKGNYAIYHSLSCNIIYGDKILKDLFAFFSDYNRYKNFDQKNKSTKKIYKILYQQGFLIENNIKDEKKLSDLQQQVRKKFFIKTLYLSLTYKCNLRCSYCISNNSVALDNNQKITPLNMDQKTAKMAADFYLKNVKAEGDKEVVFYGGEPLLNYKIMKFLVNYINQKEANKILKNKNYKKSRYILCTNGTLINNEVAKFLKENSIYPAVTFDGDEQTHDNVRKYANQKGSYADVLKAYKLLQKHNFPIGVTLTLGKHNIYNLDKFVKLFAQKLKPFTMATNIMVDYEGGGNEYVCEGNVLADNLIKAFKIARQKGLYLVKYVMDNRIKPFVEQKPRLKGCTGTGSRIMVLPDGSLSACMAYAKNSPTKLQDAPRVKDFIPTGIEYYSPFFKNECRACFAVSCCGGGCPKNAENKHGTFFALDDDYCIQSKKFLEWLIWDLFKIIAKKELKTKLFLIPKLEDRRKIYGKIKVFSNPLDFQYAPNIKQNEK
ncbi:MAG TPA: radical SAM protein [bacterium]|nr:radical SAM protein [bacterium]HPL95392.1 radical SAM protein [bacterium]